MFDEKIILARLQAGEDIQKIANEMAALINTVNQEYQAAEAKKRAEVEAKKQYESQKREELDKILLAATEWFNKYYPNSGGADAIAELSTDEVIEFCDNIDELAKTLTSLAKDLEVKAESAAPVGTRAIKKTKESADKVLNDFLKTMGW